jgi:hypothetical protein
VRVALERHGYAGMAEQVLDKVGVRAASEQECRGGVAQVVPSYVRQARASEQESEIAVEERTKPRTYRQQRSRRRRTRVLGRGRGILSRRCGSSADLLPLGCALANSFLRLDSVLYQPVENPLLALV